MVNPLAMALGPLAGIECRRAVARGWLILVRTLAALAILAVTLIVLWDCWIQIYFNPNYLPYGKLRTGLTILEGMLISLGLVLSPALVAGTLAGEKERGALGLLLTTRMRSCEIIAARFAGKMSQMTMVLLAGVPALVLLASLAGMNADVMATLLALPAAVTFGGGGLAMAVSSVSRRGRDALLTAYLIVLLFLLSPLAASLGVSLAGLSGIAGLNPYASLANLVLDERIGSTWFSIGLWCVVGLVGLATATWRLAPSCLAQLDGGRVGRRRRRRRPVPPLDDRPMFWKELYIERAGTLGGFGWWIGAALSLLLVGVSAVLAGVMAWDAIRGSDLAWFHWAQGKLARSVGQSGLLFAWLIQWAVGLRAAVTVASEREGGTWDAILTSPLDGWEILRAKLWGCVYALRWLAASALIAWTLAVVVGAMTTEDYVGTVVQTVIVGVFMAAVGLRSSLSCATATRSMAVTIGLWLGALVTAHIVAGILMAFAWIVVFLARLDLFSLGGPGPNMARINALMKYVYIFVLNVPYALATLLLVSQMRLQFDRLAGRRAGGRIQVATDQFLHGKPTAPVGEPELAAKPPAASPLVSGRDTR